MERDPMLEQIMSVLDHLVGACNLISQGSGMAVNMALSQATMKQVHALYEARTAAPAEHV